jgi:hypothetical protein
MGNEKNTISIELNKDPLMNCVVNKLGIESIYWALLFHAMVLVYVWYTGNLFSLSVQGEFSPASSTFLQMITPFNDPIFITGIIVIIVIGYVWLRLSSELPQAFQDLERNGIIKERKRPKKGEDGKVIILRKPIRYLGSSFANKVMLPRIMAHTGTMNDYGRFLAEFEYVLNTKLSYIFGAGGVFLFLNIVYLYCLKAPIENTSILIWIDYRLYPINTILYEALWTVIYFFIAVMVWKLLLIAIYIKKLFCEFETSIKPFHPDKLGGLKPITQIVMNINLLVFAAGISFVIVYYSYLRDLIPNIWTIFAGYTVISLFLFFYPLIGARKSMKANKEKFLDLFCNPLSKEYEMIFQEFSDGIDDFDTHLDEKNLAKVTALRDFYDRANQMPVWPFDRDTILTFSSRVLLPVALILLNIVIAHFFGWVELPFLGG